MITRILICGLGSMGKRRIRLLKSLYSEVELIGVDTKVERQKDITEKYDMKTYNDFYTGFREFIPDVVFVCTPPLTHTEYVLYSLNHNAHTFSEINLSAKGYDSILTAIEKNDAIAFLSSTSLYRKEMNWIIQKIDKNVASYRYHVGQYLPDWHPWENYSEFFVSDNKTNAVREILALEFPWIFKAFGKVVDYKALKGRISTLNIGYPDTFHILLGHESGTMGSLTIDCSSAKATRQLEVYTDDNFYQWEGLPNTLKTYNVEEKRMIPILLYNSPNHKDDYADFIIENPYQEEIKDFFEAINNGSNQTGYSYMQDKEVIKLIDKIEST